MFVVVEIENVYVIFIFNVFEIRNYVFYILDICFVTHLLSHLLTHLLSMLVSLISHIIIELYVF